jgi:hypothetical protein
LVTSVPANRVVSEQLHQVAGEPRIVRLRQFTGLDAELAGDGEQQGHRHVAPVVLDEVEIARRYPEARGELGLRHAALPAQPPDLAADLRGAILHGSFSLYRIYDSGTQTLQDFAT